MAFFVHFVEPVEPEPFLLIALIPSNQQVLTQKWALLSWNHEGSRSHFWKANLEPCTFPQGPCPCFSWRPESPRHGTPRLSRTLNISHSLREKHERVASANLMAQLQIAGLG